MGPSDTPAVSRLTRRQALHEEIQELLLAFARGEGPNISLPSALEELAAGTNALFGTARVEVWLHDRRERQLSLAAASPPRHAAPVPIHADEPPARGLRLEDPRLEQEGGVPVLLAPLRGWRRALGTLVIEGLPAELEADSYCDAARELSRQLSSAIEKVQLLDEVLRHRRLLEDTFNSLVELVVVVDADGRIVQTNEAFAARVGLPPEDLLARPLGGFVGEELARWLGPAPAGNGSGRTRSLQLEDERLDGVFAATVTPLVHQGGTPGGQVLVLRDITAETRLEREQAALRQQLAQSEKLASLGQFVAGIAHEMNNPLQGVLGHLELLITASEAARPVRPTLKRIYHEGERAAKIVRNLLVFAGSQRMARRRVKLERVLTRALSSRAAALRRAGITVVRHPVEIDTLVLGDPLLLQQAFLNVLINAEQAIMRRRAPGHPRIEIAIDAASPSHIRTTIRDTGPGIATDALPRVFDPFFTTKEVGAGTGLGLAITYGIIQEHGGTIEASNAPECGAIFTIDLPAARSLAPSPESARV